jgi:hypothetical protein
VGNNKHVNLIINIYYHFLTFRQRHPSFFNHSSFAFIFIGVNSYSYQSSSCFLREINSMSFNFNLIRSRPFMLS